MLESVNNILSDVSLTNFQLLKRSYNLWCTALGGIIAIGISYYDFNFIEYAIGIQCVGNSILAIFDSKAYYMMDKG